MTLTQDLGHHGRRFRRTALLALAAALALSACGSSSGGGTTSGADTGTGKLTLAVFNPFSGADASFGPLELAGCIPAAAAIEAAGGILNHKQVVCQPVDSRGDPADAVPAAKQLIASLSGLIGIIGPSSDEATATVALFNAAHLPMFADTGQATFDKSHFQYFYRITPPDDAEGVAMGVYAKNTGYSRVATVFGNDISSQGTAPTALATLRKLGVGIVVNQKISLDQTSYRTEVEQLAAAKPQAILTEADPQTSATYLAEMKQLYHLIPIIGTTGTIDPAWFKAVGGAIGSANVARLYSAPEPYAPSTGPAYREWIKDITAVKSQVAQPASQWFANSYTIADWDSVNLIALAAEEAKSANPAVFNPYIVRIASPSPGAVQVHSFAEGKRALLAGKKIQYVGGVGVITFDQYRNSPGEFAVLKSNGRPISVLTATQIAAAK